MNSCFAEVVEDVRQLSFDEKTELKNLLEFYLIEERRDNIFENGERARRELENGELKFSSDLDEIVEFLNG